jgi:hypothetical protein
MNRNPFFILGNILAMRKHLHIHGRAPSNGECLLYKKQCINHAFKQPLTKEQLRGIQNRNLDSVDVRALLWEIARLRALLVRADQLQRSLGNIAGGPGIVLVAFRKEVKDESCITEFPRLLDSG